MAYCTFFDKDFNQNHWLLFGTFRSDFFSCFSVSKGALSYFENEGKIFSSGRFNIGA